MRKSGMQLRLVTTLALVIFFFVGVERVYLNLFVLYLLRSKCLNKCQEE